MTETSRIESSLMQALGADDSNLDPQLAAAVAVSQHNPPSLPLVPAPQHHANQNPSDPSLNGSKDPFSVLARIPNDIATVRQRLFDLEEPIEFTQADWDKYWPYIDNVWCLHHRHDASEGLAKGHPEKFWGGCRLQRKWDHHASTPPTKGLRNRQKRETGTCQSKFKLTVYPDGRRTLERSTKETHSHDLNHIDSVKRNSGVRQVVLDPFFGSWEPATIMAYLRDPTHFHRGRDMLNEAGGRYLERREVMNIITQNLRKLYPGIDISVIKKEQEKYKAVKMCNAKGCNMSFTDYKSLLAHRKSVHAGAEKTQNYSHRKYTCPQKGCHRKKKSKGLVSVTSLREHQIKLKHYGQGTFHSPEGPQLCPEVTEKDTLEALRAERQAEAGDGLDETMLEDDDSQNEDGDDDVDQISPSSLQLNSATQSMDHASLLPLIQATASLAEQHHNQLLIDPAMQSQPRQSQLSSLESSMRSSLPTTQPSFNDSNLSMEQREQIMERYRQLEQEMTNLRNMMSLH